jgi:hypothetical protein
VARHGIWNLRSLGLGSKTPVSLSESLALIYTSVLASGKRRIQTRCENVIKIILKLIRNLVQ